MPLGHGGGRIRHGGTGRAGPIPQRRSALVVPVPDSGLALTAVAHSRTVLARPSLGRQYFAQFRTAAVSHLLGLTGERDHS